MKIVRSSVTCEEQQVRLMLMMIESYYFNLILFLKKSLLKLSKILENLKNELTKTKKSENGLRLRISRISDLMDEKEQIIKGYV